MTAQTLARVAAAGLLAFGAWRLYQASQDSEPEAEQDGPQPGAGGDWLGSAGDVLAGAGESAAEWVDNITGGYMRVSAMARVSPADLNNRNVQALLAVIRRGEGTADEAGYRRIFGGQLFDSFADHPRVTVRKSGYTSSAAGAYQMLASTWDETRRLMNLPDFSPRSQDLAALGRLAARGALEDVKAGRFDDAMRKIGREWASMPSSPYGQPVISWETARQLFASAGGVDTAFA